MAARGGDSLAALALEEAPAPPPRLALAAQTRPSQRGAYWLYWAHVATLFGLAVSNASLGLAVLAAPRSGRLRRLLARDVRPLLVALVAYVLWLGLAVVTSFDPRYSFGDLR